MKIIDSDDPRLHSLNIQGTLQELIDHMEYDISLVNEARFRVLAEASREVLKALHKTFDDYLRGTGKAWGGASTESHTIKPHE